MTEKMKVLLRQQRSCVLATTDGETPQCSLMAYIASETADTIFLVTPRNTRKYRNIINNPHVSLLIDTRGDRGPDNTKALTVAGTCVVLEDDEEIARVKAAFKRQHPHLEGFLHKEDVAFLGVEFEAFLFLDGPEHAQHETLGRRDRR